MKSAIFSIVMLLGATAFAQTITYSGDQGVKLAAQVQKIELTAGSSAKIKAGQETIVSCEAAKAKAAANGVVCLVERNFYGIFHMTINGNDTNVETATLETAINSAKDFVTKGLCDSYEIKKAN